MDSIQESFERFLAIASSTARNCFRSSSRRVDFDDDDDEFALAELFALSAAPLFVPDDAGGERFLAAASTALFLLQINGKTEWKMNENGFDSNFNR